MSVNEKIHALESKSKSKIKTEKIADYCRDSIKTLRIGFTLGHQGAYFFWAKGKKLDKPKFKILVANLKLLKDLNYDSKCIYDRLFMVGDCFKIM